MATSRIARLGILGDIHGAIGRLELAIATFDRIGVDAIASVGDLVDGHGDAHTDVGGCIDILAHRRAFCVRGNHDRWFLQNTLRSLRTYTKAHELTADQRGFVGWLPVTQTLETVAGTALLCHGLADDDMTFFDPHVGPEGDDQLRALFGLAAAEHAFVLCGHTHRRAIASVGRQWFVNAGALTFSKRSGFGWIDFERREAEFFDFATPMTSGDRGDRELVGVERTPLRRR